MKKGYILLLAMLSASLVLTACDSNKDASGSKSTPSAQQDQGEAGAQDANQTAEQSEMPSQTLRVKGNVVFSATDISVPSDAELTISLRDIALADTPSMLIAKTTLKPGNQGPVHFQLEYNTDDVDTQHSHALHGELRNSAGDLLWVSASRHSIDVSNNAGHDTVTLTLEPVRAANATGSMQDTQKNMLTPASSEHTPDDGSLDALESQAENIQEPSAPAQDNLTDKSAGDAEAADQG